MNERLLVGLERRVAAILDRRERERVHTEMRALRAAMLEDTALVERLRREAVEADAATGEGGFTFGST